MKCSERSIIQAVCKAAEYGMALDDKLVYAIPHHNKIGEEDGKPIKEWQVEATFDYKALVAVARRHKIVSDVRAQDVREKDEFDWYEEDFKQRYKFRKFLEGDRGEVVGVFAVVTFPDGTHRFEHMAHCELRQVRSASKAPNSPAWKNWEGQMYQKAVVKRVLKTCQDDPVLSSLLDYDNSEFDLEKDATPTARPISELNDEILGIERHAEQQAD